MALPPDARNVSVDGRLFMVSDSARTFFVPSGDHNLIGMSFETFAADVRDLQTTLGEPADAWDLGDHQWVREYYRLLQLIGSENLHLGTWYGHDAPRDLTLVLEKARCKSHAIQLYMVSLKVPGKIDGQALISGMWSGKITRLGDNNSSARVLLQRAEMQLHQGRYILTAGTVGAVVMMTAEDPPCLWKKPGFRVPMFEVVSLSGGAAKVCSPDWDFEDGVVCESYDKAGYLALRLSGVQPK